MPGVTAVRAAGSQLDLTDHLYMRRDQLDAFSTQPISIRVSPSALAHQYNISMPTVIALLR